MATNQHGKKSPAKKKIANKKVRNKRIAKKQMTLTTRASTTMGENVFFLGSGSASRTCVQRHTRDT
jgi:hypothetical protein